MNELAQALALVAHGNAALAGGDGQAAMEHSNSTFRFVRSVSFEVERRFRGTATVSSVHDWLNAVRGASVERLSLIAGAAAPTASADHWRRGVMGHARGRTYVWHGRWVLNQEGVDPSDPQRRIWEVNYHLSSHDETLDWVAPNVEATTRRLQGAIGEALVFARAHDLTPFDGSFEDALAMADSPTGELPYYPDMLPERGYTLDARRLLAMATRSWVFGGMGSWNDLGFSDPDTRAEYEGVTHRLHEAVLDGIRDATNAFEWARRLGSS